MTDNVDDLVLDVAEPGLRLGVRHLARSPECRRCGHARPSHRADGDGGGSCVVGWTIRLGGGMIEGCMCPDFQPKPKSSRRNSREVVDAGQPEADYQKQIVDLAEACGWYVWHDTDPRRNLAGLPDLLMVRGAVLLFLEVKTEKGKASPAQEAFIQRLKQVKYVHADIVRPRHFEQIADVLRSANR